LIRQALVAFHTKLAIAYYLKKSKSFLLSIFYDVFICDSELNWDRYRSSYGKIISKFHLLDLNKVSWMLLRRINENRNSIYALFLDLLEFIFIIATILW